MGGLSRPLSPPHLLGAACVARCQYCSELSISQLVALSETEFEGHSFPRQAFFQHHGSFQDLEKAANGGCDLCQLILDCFKGSPNDSDRPYLWPEEWLGSECNIKTSMYNIAMRLPDSNVRISISSSHLYGSDSIDKVIVFDMVMVQIGPRAPPYDSSASDADDWEFPTLRLKLDSPREHHCQVGRFRIGQYQLDPDLGSSTNFSIARHWLRTCQHEHVCCRSTECCLLPTRVISVGSNVDFSDVYLLCSEGIKAEYVTLSHCWGGPISPLLTTNTLEMYQRCLPYTSLPANFQDAIVITRQLGIKYLWIDSLCILQDSKEDWEYESNMMGQIYSDATVEISAIASRESKQGILQSQLKNPASVCTTLPIYPNGDSNENVRIWRIDRAEENLQILDMNGPLSRRGWTYQEKLLSYRILFYGEHQIYWKCMAGYEAANGVAFGLLVPEMNSEVASSLIPSITSLSSSSHIASSSHIMLAQYYELVQDYSQRKLTYDKDKLPAFSAIAQRLRPRIGGDYLAGLWSNDIVRGLCWWREMRTAKHVEPYRAPSWSWASTNESVVYTHEEFHGGFSNVQLLSHNIVLKSETNLYGEVCAGSFIVLKGLTKVLIRSKQIITLRNLTDTFGHLISDEGDDHDMTSEDTGTQMANQWESEVVFWMLNKNNDETYLVSVKTVRATGRDWEVDTSLYKPESYLVLLLKPGTNENCLVLEQVGSPEDNTYQRVGCISYRSSESEPVLDEEWEMRTIVLI